MKRVLRFGPLGRASSPTSAGAQASVPELNLLPPELTARRLTTEEGRLLLMGLLLVALALLQFQILGDRALATGQALLPARFQGQDPQAAQAAALTARADKLEGEVRVLEGKRQAVERVRIPWGDLIRYIYASAPEGVIVDSVRQSGKDATVAGTGATSTAVTDYRLLLQESPAIGGVDLASVARDTATGRFSYSFRLIIVPGKAVDQPS